MAADVNSFGSCIFFLNRAYQYKRGLLSCPLWVIPGMRQAAFKKACTYLGPYLTLSFWYKSELVGYVHFFYFGQNRARK